MRPPTCNNSSSPSSRPAWLRAGILCVILSGCFSPQYQYNLASQREEFTLTSDEREVRMGEAIAEQVLKKFKPLDDPATQERIRALGERLAAVCDRKSLLYHFTVIQYPHDTHVKEGDDVNAFAIPGGYVFVFEGLVKAAKDDDELAGVVAHEIGHIAARHPVKRYESSLGTTLVQALAGATRDARFARGVSAALGQLYLAYSREDELLADRLGVRYMKDAGFDPEGMLRFLQTLQEIHRREIRPFSYFRTHPYIADRIRVVKEEAFGKIDFTDHINRSDD